MKGRAIVALAGAAAACVAWFVVYRRRRQSERGWDFADISHEQAEERGGAMSMAPALAGVGQELREMEAEDRLMEAIVALEASAAVAAAGNRAATDVAAVLGRAHRERPAAGTFLLRASDARQREREGHDGRAGRTRHDVPSATPKRIPHKVIAPRSGKKPTSAL